MTKQLSHQIDEIMNNFQFNKVARAMAVLNWEWNSCEGVPDERTIRSTARIVLESAGISDPGYCSTGGLVARYKGGILTLQFVLEDWEAGQ